MLNWKSFVAGAGASAIIVGVALAQAVAPPAATKPAGAPEAAVARTGTFVIKLTLTRQSTSMLGSNRDVYCLAQAYHYGVGNVFYSEEGGIFAPGTSCTIKLPYNWPAADSANPVVHVRVWVQTGKDNFPTDTLPSRRVTADFTEVPLPSNGATTNLNKTIHY